MTKMASTCVDTSGHLFFRIVIRGRGHSWKGYGYLPLCPKQGIALTIDLIC